jgi:hypothetical protein
MVVSALIASLNPAINPRQNSGSDSQEVRAPAGRPCRQQRLPALCSIVGWVRFRVEIVVSALTASLNPASNLRSGARITLVRRLRTRSPHHVRYAEEP